MDNRQSATCQNANTVPFCSFGDQKCMVKSKLARFITGRKSMSKTIHGFYDKELGRKQYVTQKYVKSKLCLTRNVRNFIVSAQYKTYKNKQVFF